MANGYSDGLWGTYRQWQDAGAQVRKGERSTTVVLWKQIGSSDSADDDDGDDSGRVRMFARAFSVFNIAQADGYERPPMSILPEEERLAHADAFIANLGIKTAFGGSEACYVPSSDTVFMPDFASFRDAASFYGVWLHENGHASGARHSLTAIFPAGSARLPTRPRSAVWRFSAGLCWPILASPIIRVLIMPRTLPRGSKY